MWVVVCDKVGACEWWYVDGGTWMVVRGWWYVDGGTWMVV